MNNRQEYNIKIAEFLLEKAKSEDGKHLRFTQLLFNVGINEFSEQTKKYMNDLTAPVFTNTLKDKYNEESKVTYEKLIK